MADQVTPLPKTNLVSYIQETMNPVFGQSGDVFKKPNFEISETTKPVWVSGAVGKVSLISNSEHPFTGIFKGGKEGLIRLSTMMTPSLDNLSAPISPGMGLKFLRDGVDSANIVSAVGYNGTPNDWNYFNHSLTNHMEGVKTMTVLAMEKMLAGVTEFTQDVGLSDFAKYDENGKQEAPIIPFELIFEPHSDVKNLFKNTKPEKASQYLEDLKSVKVGSNLYDVYGLTAPKMLDGKKVLIGTLRLDSPLVSSKFGDEALFFRHQQMSDDLALHPEWKAFVPYASLGGKCPYELMLKKLNLY